MKKLIILSLFLLKLSNAFSQLSTTLAMSTNPTPRITDWMNDNTVLTFVVSSPFKDNSTVLIKTELKLSDGTVIASQDLTKVPFTIVSQGNNIYHAKDVLPLSLMQFAGSYKAALDRTGLLPSGNYQITVQLVSPQGYAPVSQPQTKNFFIPILQLPVLIKPYSNQHLEVKEAQTAIIFRWTPLLPKTTGIVNYRIQAFEVYSYQQTVQALRSNPPLLDEVVKMQTQYIWRPQLSFIDDSVKKFIWTIQTLDAGGNVVAAEGSNQESRSEPFIFYVD